MKDNKTTLQSQLLFTNFEFREVDPNLNVAIGGAGTFPMPLAQWGEDENGMKKSIQWGDVNKGQDSSCFYINGYGPFKLAGVDGPAGIMYFKGTNYEVKFDGNGVQLNSESEQKTRGEDIQTFRYDTPYQAERIWYALPEPQKRSIAQSYISAFEGAPWFEVGWYNVDDLVNKDLPDIIKKLAPGVMVLKFKGAEIVGACMGGMTTIGDLITNKYKGNQDILSEVLYNTNLQLTDPFFYDNENFISQTVQGKRMGSGLNYQYFKTILESGVEQFLWRTINIQWGETKTKQALELGYNVTRFQVSDNFSVNDVPTPRYVYYCKKAVSGQKGIFIDMCES
jgi:hypothetical protein